MPTTTSNSAPVVSVMLIDDSAVVRGLLSRVLEEDPSIRVVATASDGQQGLDALKKMSTPPDIIILDIEMPVMDGLTALPLILKAAPGARVLICSTLSLKGADVTMKALSMGAADTIAKPTAAGTIISSGGEFKENLIHMVKQIARASKKFSTAAPATEEVERTKKTGVPIVQFGQNKTIALRDPRSAFSGKPAIVAIGSSTGGPPALFTVLKSCKDIDVPIVITQHMPPTFTAMLAKHITANTGLPAGEGLEGETLQPGQVYIAPGGNHMTIKLEDGKPTIRLNQDPPENFCRPAVDPMFRSLAQIYKNRILAVILTGMGSDGYLSSKELVEMGARLVAQDEATSVVWGMPGTVATGGLCHAVLPLQDIGPMIYRTVMMR